MVGRPLRGAGLSTDLLARAAAHLTGVRRLGVAFSGGVDSAVLLAVAARTLGPDRVVALLGVSPSLPAHERDAAHAVAAGIGVEVVEVVTREGDNPAYVANGPDRCFHCKDELFTVIGRDVVAAHGLDAVAYGENADDALRPDRPGAQAATDHRVLRPLADAGLTKADVRALAREFDLPVADKPAAPCLASRIPHGQRVTPEKLAQVEAAEAAVRALGFADCRVRHHGDVARVEVLDADLVRAVQVREPLLAGVRAAGFRFVTLDLAGIQSGAFTLPFVSVETVQCGVDSREGAAQGAHLPRPEGEAARGTGVAQLKGEGVRSTGLAQLEGEGMRGARPAQPEGQGVRGARPAQVQGEGVRGARPAQVQGEEVRGARPAQPKDAHEEGPA